MNKTFGLKSEYKLIKHQGTRITLSYGFTLEEDNEHATWYEIYFNTKRNKQLSLDQIKKAIISHIDSRTDEHILNGYPWTILHGDDVDKQVSVWLSTENQTNFKAEHDTALAYPDLITWPKKFKLSEDENGNAVYEYFNNMQELASFYLGAISYIKTCIDNGWEEKDNMDWTVYEDVIKEMYGE